MERCLPLYVKQAPSATTISFYGISLRAIPRRRQAYSWYPASSRKHGTFAHWALIWAQRVTQFCASNCYVENIQVRNYWLVLLLRPRPSTNPCLPMLYFHLAHNPVATQSKCSYPSLSSLANTIQRQSQLCSRIAPHCENLREQSPQSIL